MKNLINETSKAKLINSFFVLIFAIYGISQQNFKFDSMSLFQQVMLEALGPLQQGTTSAKSYIDSIVDHYFFLVGASKENEILNKKVSKLENKIFVLKEIKRENERLKRLFEFGKDIPRKKVLAQVVGWDASNEFKVLKINKGSNHGLKILSPVITMNGLVGYIYSISNNFSEILTILDQNNRVDSIIDRTRSHGIVEGMSDFTCRMKYVLRNDPVEVGDVILTAGLGEIYPKGIRVGKVSLISKQNHDLVQKIEINPSVNFEKLEEVLVLLEQEKSSDLDINLESSMEAETNEE